MPRFENAELEVAFSLPDNPTVRQQMRWKAQVAFAEDAAEVYEVMWERCFNLVEDWESDLIPEPGEVDLDTETDTRVAEAVMWVAGQIWAHMNGLDEIEKKA